MSCGGTSLSLSLYVFCFLDGQGQYSEFEKVLTLAAHDDPRAAAAKMRTYLARLLFRRLLARLRAGLVWIGVLRAVREKRDHAYALLKRNVHRKQSVKKWTAWIRAEARRVEAVERETRAAATLASWLFQRLMATSDRFQRRHPSGQPQRRPSGDNPGAARGAGPARSHPGAGAALAAVVAAAVAANAELEVQASAFLAHAALLKGASADRMAIMREEVVIHI